jgi:transposase
LGKALPKLAACWPTSAPAGGNCRSWPGKPSANCRTACATLDERILAYDRKISALAKACEPARRLMAIEGVGPVTATALVASVGNASAFKSGRQFAAWLGLTPRQNSSGGKTKLGSISKRGDVTLRTLLIHGTRSALRLTAGKTDRKSVWAEALKGTPLRQRGRRRPRRQKCTYHLGHAVSAAPNTQWQADAGLVQPIHPI